MSALVKQLLKREIFSFFLKYKHALVSNMGGKSHGCQIQLGSLAYLKRSTENTLTEILLVTISLSGFTLLHSSSLSFFRIP